MRKPIVYSLIGEPMKEINNDSLKAIIRACTENGFEVFRMSTMQDEDEAPEIHIVMRQQKPPEQI